MRVAVTGSGGRLGRAMIQALEEAPFTGPMGPIAWSRPELDLDTLDEAAVACAHRPRPARGGGPHGGVDGRRRLRP